MTNHILALILLLNLSCGRAPTQEFLKKTKDEHQNKNQFESVESDIGLFQAKLKSVHPEMFPKFNGSLTIMINLTHFIADIRFSKGPVQSLHHQNIHLGSRCPDSGDDLNGDRIIDYQEGMRAYGNSIIPLDDDLSSQRMGYGIFPVTDDFGNYLWSRSTLLSKMIDDLNLPDLNQNDSLEKLHKPKLDIQGKTVIILGVAKNIELPETVQARDYLDPHSSLPVACGVLTKVDSSPGIIDRDEGTLFPKEFYPREDDGADFPENNDQPEEQKNPVNYGD